MFEFKKVYLARKKDTGEICALKQMNKKKLLKSNEVCIINNI